MVHTLQTVREKVSMQCRDAEFIHICRNIQKRDLDMEGKLHLEVFESKLVLQNKSQNK